MPASRTTEGLLSELVRDGVCSELDSHFARALTRIGDDHRAEMVLAAALAHRQTRQGHTCLPLAETPERILGPEAVDAQRWPSTQRWRDVLRSSALVGGDDRRAPFVLDSHDRLYLRRFWALERSVAKHLRERFGRSKDRVRDDAWILERMDEWLDPRTTDEQRAAVSIAVQHSCALISGQPGTGKTSAIVSALALIIEDWQSHRREAPRISLLAPTGKAAARLSNAVQRGKASLRAPERVLDAIPSEASTIHRALGAREGGRGFRFTADRPLLADVVVVDEASMVDLALMHALLEALPDDADLILIGDPDQLASVEAGSVFADICEVARSDEALPAAWLTTQHRYEASSGIAQLAEAVRQGDTEAVLSLFAATGHTDLSFLPTDALSDAVAQSQLRFETILDGRDRTAQLEALGAGQVLCAHRHGPLSTGAINDQIGRRWSGHVVPVIVERNRYELDLYNGDVGLLDEGDGRAFFLGSGPEARTVPESLLPPHDLAFAISIHKSQGSEFDEVTLVLPDEDSPLLSRELFYTGVTRAKERVVVIGSEATLRRTLARDGRRTTGLKDALLRADA